MSAEKTTERAVESDYWDCYDALREIVSLRAEHNALHGGGPGWQNRWYAAMETASKVIDHYEPDSDE